MPSSATFCSLKTENSMQTFFPLLPARKPEALVPAIKNFITMKFLEAKLISLQFYNPFERSVEVRSWKDVFKQNFKIVRARYPHPSPGLRIKLLKLVVKLMNNEVSLKSRSL